MSNLPDQLAAGALCSLVDVVRRVPGYDAGDDGEIDEILNELIVRESQDFMEVTGREIVPVATDPAQRTFDLTRSNIVRRKVRLGDCATVTAVELFDYDETTSLDAIASTRYVLEPRNRRAAWEPIRWIRFPYRPGLASPSFAVGRTLKITGTWGFPEIPQTVRTGVASLVIWRYVNDVAAEGTPFADAVNRADFNFAQALRVALDVRDRLRDAPFA